MKYCLNRLTLKSSRFLFQEIRNDQTTETQTEQNFSELIKTYIESGTTIPDDVIQAEAARCVAKLGNSSQLGPLLERTLKDQKITEINGLCEKLEATRDQAMEESNVEKPLSTEDLDKIWKEYLEKKTGPHIPDSMHADIKSYVLHNLETKDLTPAEVKEKTVAMIEDQAIFHKMNQFHQTDAETGEERTETTTQTLQQALEDIAKKHEINPQLLYRAIAMNYQGFNLDEDRNPLDYEKEAYLKNADELAQKLKEQRAAAAEIVRQSGVDPNTPAGQQAIAQQLGVASQGSENMSLWDLIKMIMDAGKSGSSTSNATGQPLNSAMPQGTRYSGNVITQKGRLDQMQAHQGPIELNERFYGQDLVNKFHKLPEDIQNSAKTIAATMQPGWDKAVMRNAVNSHKYGQPFSSQRVFVVHDVTRQTCAIYVPGKGTKYVPSTHGRGVGNQPGSNQTPLGSFTTNSMTHVGINSSGRGRGDKYNYRMSVEGMEPMRARMSTDRRTAMSMDPGAGNTNSHGRVIRIHDTGGGTAGCTGLRNEDAAYLSTALRAHGGGSFEVITSVG